MSQTPRKGLVLGIYRQVIPTSIFIQFSRNIHTSRDVLIGCFKRSSTTGNQLRKQDGPSAPRLEEEEEEAAKIMTRDYY